MPPFSKNSGIAQYWSKSFDSFFKTKFKVSSFQENQVQASSGTPNRSEKFGIFFQPIISGSGTQLLGERERESIVYFTFNVEYFQKFTFRFGKLDKGVLNFKV